MSSWNQMLYDRLVGNGVAAAAVGEHVKAAAVFRFFHDLNVDFSGDAMFQLLASQFAPDDKRKVDGIQLFVWHVDIIDPDNWRAHRR